MAGCSDTEPGTPSPSTSELADATPPAPSSSESLPAYGAPKVDNPLDLNHFKTQRPCDAITDAEMTEFFGSDVTKKPDLDGAAGPACSWDVNPGQAGIGIIFGTVTELGLSALYRKRDEWAVFDELAPASGYPAVSYNLGDERPQGRCTIRVGTSDTETVDVSLALSEDKIGQIDPCEATHEVASTVIDNIKERN
jgi:hypothetical protein